MPIIWRKKPTGDMRMKNSERSLKPVTIYQPFRISFGPGCIDQLADDLTASGTRKIFLVTFPEILPRIPDFTGRIHAEGIQMEVDTSIKSEPVYGDFYRILESARKFDPDVVIGLGGGSVLDVAKLVAAQIKNTQSLDEITGINLLKERKVRLVCVPTTAGTGSEVSPNAILLDEKEQLKKGIISPHLVPDQCFVDPELTMTVPPEVTAATGIDAFTHCLEAYVNRNAHPVIDRYAVAGMKLIFHSLEDAFRNGNDLDARSDMALGSLYGGMCLGPVNTTAIHALSYPLGSTFHIPHGLSNALLLPHVMDFNLPAAEERYAEVAAIIGFSKEGSVKLRARQAVERVRDLMERCRVPSRMSDLGIPEEAIPSMADSALKIQRLLKNNPREVTKEDAMGIYRNAY
jgi:alcohol dehydrogenase class IV